MTATITTDQIIALRDEAGQHGDAELHRLCEAALAGDEDARAECEQVIRDAQAMVPPEERDVVAVTVTQTGAPSRSKQAGPCWILLEHGDESVYATERQRSLTVPSGATVTAKGKVTLRRATRTSVDYDRWTLVATGDPQDTVELSIGSPQSVDALVTGARLAS